MLSEKAKKIQEMLRPMFEEAVREKKWFLCTYQGMEFSPKELRDRQAKGELNWGPVNWRLIDPPKPIDIQKQIRRMEIENTMLEKRISAGWEI